MSAMPRSETDAVSTTVEHEESVLLEWTVHLMRRDPRRARVVLATIVLAALAGALLFHSIVFAVVGPLVLFLSTSEYLLPNRYRLTTRRAAASCGLNRLEIPWSGVRRLQEGHGAVKLSPLASEVSRLEAFRGVLLHFAPDGEPGDRESVLRVVARCVPETLAPHPSPLTPSLDGDRDG